MHLSDLSSYAPDPPIFDGLIHQGGNTKYEDVKKNSWKHTAEIALHV